MKNYLDLIPLSAKVHRKQSRMTRICIGLAVFLVSVIFGMADMEMRCLKVQAIETDGSWHAGFRTLTDEQAALIEARPEVESAARYDCLNYRIADGYTIDGTETVICGFDPALENMYPAASTSEGHFPEDMDSVVCTESIRDRLGIRLGDPVTVTRPDGAEVVLTVCGFTKTTSMLTKADAFGIYLNTEAFRTHFQVERPSERDGMLYVKFVPYCNIQKAISGICDDFGLTKEDTSQNVKVLTLLFQTRDPYMMQFYLVAAVLAVLVSIAGILMIAGSLNSNVAQRTEFFGLMRCLGATRKQTARFVRREALGWCRRAIPAALLIGMAVIWALCAMLRYLSPGLFDELPVFGISWIGLLAGILEGLVTVLLAARSPAKKASGVSPLAALSGNAGTVREAKSAANTRFFRVETAMGIHHAWGSRKNFLLMSGSFAFGIVLFLAFGSLKDFMDHALVPLRPWSPDISISSPDNGCSVPRELAQELSGLPSVKRVYGRSFGYEIPARIGGEETKILLISYEQYQLDWAEEFLLEGTTEAILEGETVLTVADGEPVAGPGDQILIDTPEGWQEIPVSGTLSECPFDREKETAAVLCSEELFQRLTGEKGYTILDIQLQRTASDEDVQKIRSMAGENVGFSDQRMSNREVMGAYYSFLLFLYGFLAVILLISAFHIINSMSMSVSARMKEYGAMRAIGMTVSQMLRMTGAEACTYALSGIGAGILIGLPIHQFFYRSLITSRWGTDWAFPAVPLLIVVLVVLLSAFLSVVGPAGRIRNLSAAETLNAS